MKDLGGWPARRVEGVQVFLIFLRSIRVACLGKRGACCCWAERRTPPTFMRMFDAGGRLTDASGSPLVASVLFGFF